MCCDPVAEGPGDSGSNRFNAVNERLPDVDVRSLVVVPARPGLPVSLQALERGHDEIDDMLDDVFGAPDERGPGIVDAVLVAGGLAALLAGLSDAASTFVTVLGIAAVLLGAVLPIRSLWWRFGSARRSARLGTLLGDGVLLRIDDSGIQNLVAVHQRLMAASAALAPVLRARVQEVAHAALLEVASLFGRHVPVTQVDRLYVTDRLRALQKLQDVLDDPFVGDGESERRQALIQARHEVEQIAGNSITDAAALSRELLGGDDS